MQQRWPGTAEGDSRELRYSPLPYASVLLSLQCQLHGDFDATPATFCALKTVRIGAAAAEAIPL